MAHFGKKKVYKTPSAVAGKDEQDEFIRKVRAEIAAKEADYRRRSLELHPWVCAKCGREFNESNLHLLTVHHKDGNHRNNPPDGSNWENLCIYCHEDEHARGVLADYVSETGAPEAGKPSSEDDKGSGLGTMNAAFEKFMKKKT